MKCLILVGRSSFIDETRNSTSLVLYVPTITRVQNKSANNMYTVCSFCPCFHDGVRAAGADKEKNICCVVWN